MIFWSFGARQEWVLAELSIQVWLMFLKEAVTLEEFSMQYTDQHDSFSFASEAGKAKEEVETSSSAFLVSETSEKLP